MPPALLFPETLQLVNAPVSVLKLWNEMAARGEFRSPRRALALQGCADLTYDDIDAEFFRGHVTLHTFAHAMNVARAKGGNPHSIRPLLRFAVAFEPLRTMKHWSSKMRGPLNHLLLAIDNGGFVHRPVLTNLQLLFATLNRCWLETEWAVEKQRIEAAIAKLATTIPPSTAEGSVSLMLHLQWTLPDVARRHVQYLHARSPAVLASALVQLVRNAPNVPGGSLELLAEAIALAQLCPSDAALISALYHVKVRPRDDEAFVALAAALERALRDPAARVLLDERVRVHVVWMLGSYEVGPAALRVCVGIMNTLAQRDWGQLSFVLRSHLEERLRSLRVLSRHLTPLEELEAAERSDTPLDPLVAPLVWKVCDMWDTERNQFKRSMTAEQLRIRMRTDVACLERAPQRHWERRLVGLLLAEPPNVCTLVAAFAAGRRRGLALPRTSVRHGLLVACDAQPSEESAALLEASLRNLPKVTPFEYRMHINLLPSCADVLRMLLEPDRTLMRDLSVLDARQLQFSIALKFARDYEYLPLALFILSAQGRRGPSFAVAHAAAAACNSTRDVWRAANLWAHLRLPAQDRSFKSRLLALSPEADREGAESKIHYEFIAMQQRHRQRFRSASEAKFERDALCCEVTLKPSGESLWFCNVDRLARIVSQMWSAPPSMTTSRSAQTAVTGKTSPNGAATEEEDAHEEEEEEEEEPESAVRRHQ